MERAPQSLLHVRHSDFIDYDYEICRAPDFADQLLPKCNLINNAQLDGYTMDVYYKLPTLEWAHDSLEMRCQSTDFSNKTFTSVAPVSTRITGMSLLICTSKYIYYPMFIKHLMHTGNGNKRKPRVCCELPPSCSWHNLSNMSVTLPPAYVPHTTKRTTPRIISTTTPPPTTSTGRIVFPNLSLLPAENKDGQNREGRPLLKVSSGNSGGGTQTGERDKPGQGGARGVAEADLSQSSFSVFACMLFGSVFCSVFLAVGTVWVVHQSVRSRACCRKRGQSGSSPLLNPPPTPPATDPTQVTQRQGQRVSVSASNADSAIGVSPTPPSPPQLPGGVHQVFVFPSPLQQRPQQPRPGFVQVQPPYNDDYDLPYALLYENWPGPDRSDPISRSPVSVPLPNQSDFGHPNVLVRTVSEPGSTGNARSPEWVDRAAYNAEHPGTIAAAPIGPAGRRSESTDDTATADSTMEPVERNDEEEEDEEEDESTAYTMARVRPQQEVLIATQLAKIAAQNGESNPAYGRSPIVWLRSEGASSLPSAAGHIGLHLPSQTDSVCNDSVVWVPQQGGGAALPMNMYCPIGYTVPVDGSHPLVHLSFESGARLVSDMQQQQLDEAQDEMLRSTSV